MAGNRAQVNAELSFSSVFSRICPLSPASGDGAFQLRDQPSIAIHYFKDLLLAWRGRRGSLCAPQRSYGKKLVPAGFAAQRGDSQKASDDGCRAGDALCRDALQFQVAADSAVRIQESAKRHQARVKSRLAGFAAPRQDATETEEIVQHRAASGTPAIRTVANRTARRAGSDWLSPRTA